VVYDLRPAQGIGPERVIAQRFGIDGGATPFEPPLRRKLPRSRWGLSRSQCSDAAMPVQVLQTLEDTPFYVRSVIGTGLLGEPVTAMHETLHVPRLVSLPVQAMLPFRMPRRS
jgi:carotenoid 1,2-hydratase